MIKVIQNGMLRVRGISSLENNKVYWFLGFSVSSFIGFLVSWRLGFLDSKFSKFRSFKVSTNQKHIEYLLGEIEPVLPNSQFMFSIDIDPVFEVFKTNIRRIFGFVRAKPFPTFSI